MRNSTFAAFGGFLAAIGLTFGAKADQQEWLLILNLWMIAQLVLRQMETPA